MTSRTSTRCIPVNHRSAGRLTNEFAPAIDNRTVASERALPRRTNRAAEPGEFANFLAVKLRGLLALGRRLAHGWGLDRLRRDGGGLLLGLSHGRGLDRLRRNDGLLLGLGHGRGLDRLRRNDRLLLGLGHGRGLDRLRRDDGLLLGRNLDGRAGRRLRGWLHARGGLIGFVWCHQTNPIRPPRA